ncbi:MAG: TonB family protein [Verrucomicrobia bacterium]|nr:TonB family protein [Verrucomicrobiota bacterium]
MIPSNTRYFLTSVGIHAAAVGVLLFAPALSSHTVQDVPSPILEIIPDNLRLTDGNTLGGGNPDAQPPKSSPQPSAPPAPAPPAPPQPEPPKTQPQTPPPEPAKAVEPTKEPTKMEPPKKSLATEIQRSAPNAQDVDPNLSTKKLKSSKTDFQLAEAPKKRSKKEAEVERNNAAAVAAAQDAREAREHQARVTAAREALSKAQQARADAVRGVASNLGKNLSGSTSFEMPGPGGAAYAPYGSYLMAFYKLRWKKPTTLNVEHGEVEVEITVQRNGRVSAFKLVKPSGIRALDDSVREVLDGNRDLRPLPDGTTDSERRITIRFDLSAASPA